MSVFIGEKNKRVELAERKDAINPNLLSNTASFKGFTVANTTTAVSPSKDKLDPLGHVTSHATSTWQQAVNFLDIDTSSAYTLSAFIWLNGDQTIKAICRNSAGVGACSNNGTVINGIKSNCWQRISFTFQGFFKSHVAFDFEVTDGTVDFWLGSYKLEKGPVATPWCPALEDFAWTSDITNLQNAVNSKTSGTVVTAYDVASKTPTKVTDSYTDKWLVDQGALIPFADQINQLKGRRAVDAADFNTLTDSGVYMINDSQTSKNAPSSTGNAGVLAVFNGNSSRITQIYFDDNGIEAYVRIYGWINSANGWGSWNQIAWTSDITNLQSMITGLSTKVDSAVTKLQGQITEIQSKNYIEGYNCANESDAETYSKAHPNTLVTVS